MPGEGKSLREKQTLIDSGSESGMTQDCHAEVAEPQPNRSMQDLECYPAFGSSASSRRGGGRILSNLIGGQTLKRVQGDKIIKNLFTYSPTNLLTSKKAAFTLAEVLITLAIIGVVAAMTIPTLISNYKKQIVGTRLLKFYSAYNQALSLSQIDNGRMETWDWYYPYIPQEEMKTWYDTYIKPYVRTVKSVEAKIGTSRRIVDYLPDGSAVIIGYESWMFFPFASDLEFETQEYQSEEITYPKGEDSGTKWFTFSLRNNGKGVRPYGDGNDVEKLKNDSSLGCNSSVIGEKPYCAALIKANGWKIPDDYQLKF